MDALIYTKPGRGTIPTLGRFVISDSFDCPGLLLEFLPMRYSLCILVSLQVIVDFRFLHMLIILPVSEIVRLRYSLAF
jgi:hypothetical protein